MFSSPSLPKPSKVQGLWQKFISIKQHFLSFASAIKAEQAAAFTVCNLKLIFFLINIKFVMVT